MGPDQLLWKTPEPSVPGGTLWVVFGPRALEWSLQNIIGMWMTKNIKYKRSSLRAHIEVGSFAICAAIQLTCRRSALGGRIENKPMFLRL
jgi:hypothetical protein